ncbi:hypothetical protein AtNW77_Chr2g0245821 [Arabidopsis thaliana]|uniref:Transmembrane protein n=4 Tax=Arabidopsis TaxID=3701 RepID=A0A178VY27_ARATH|nr:unknown [Arabidopsis thaliana]KAG7637540.1 hypothetical protein ISN45_At02g020570 [Arabidopsis thaliana x Arabidopsis arenosa]KAG7642150.1 hypothetical protein ISN44_As02g021000 [Arabidopsis suecica]OAP10185.1 hypothetical protein AXX17_AT2G22380 [Arabidopsis thaliana]CAA0372109.1 unnamed protein product [Arabidopsis thaliana]
MASMPLYWQPPPATEVSQDSSSVSSAGNSTIGPFIAVFIVVTVLCVLASVIGRLCSGKTILGYGDYDMERWAESRCGSCIDGHIIPHRPSPSPPPPPRQHLHHTSSGVSVESEGHVADLDHETDGEKQDSLDHEPPQQTPSSAHS